jgi:CHAD domain-containing protein
MFRTGGILRLGIRIVGSCNPLSVITADPSQDLSVIAAGSFLHLQRKEAKQSRYIRESFTLHPAA